MTDRGTEPPTGGEAEPPTERSKYHSSRYWLIAAVIATVVGVTLMTAEFIGLLRFPSAEKLSIAESVDTSDSLVVVVARTPGGPEEWANWGQVIKYISDELGQPVTVRYLSQEDEAAEIIMEEDVDLAFVCAHHYVDMLDEEACVGICTPVIDGSSSTTHLLVVRADDPAEKLEDLQDAVFAVSDKSSLGGFSYLSYLTADVGMSPDEFCSELRLGESQNQNMRSVLQGTARATIVSTAQVGSWDMTRFKVIEESESIGCPPVVASERVDHVMIDRIRDILTSCDTDALLGKDSAIDGFKPLDPAEYDFAYVLRDACGHHVH